MHGAIDTHVHSFPDVVKRKLDDITLVEQARAAGMRALLLKSHVFATCERAYLLNRFYPDFHVYGGIALNDTVGGLNLKAVEAALTMGAVQVWMPTKSAANHRRHLGGQGGLNVLKDGRIREEVISILRLIAESGTALATGHLSPEESQILIEEALSAGVRRIAITHPEWGVTAMPIEVQQRFATVGGIYFERCLVSTESDIRLRVNFETIVDQIRAVGVSSTIIATDFGMPQYPTPVEGMKTFIERLLQAGFTEGDVKLMCQENPAKLLNLSTS